MVPSNNPSQDKNGGKLLSVDSSHSDNRSDSSTQIDRNSGFNRKEWVSRVRKPFLMSTAAGALWGALSALSRFRGGAVGGGGLAGVAAMRAMSVGTLGLCFFGTREYLEMRWKRLEMVERLTVSSGVAGFVAGATYRVVFSPLLSLDAASSQVKSLRRIQMRPVLATGALGAVAAIVATKAHHWWVMHKYEQLELKARLERALERAESEGQPSEETAREIEDAKQELKGFFRRRWDDITSLTSRIELPDWLREDKALKDKVRHRDEMEKIYREFERLRNETGLTQNEHNKKEEKDG